MEKASWKIKTIFSSVIIILLAIGAVFYFYWSSRYNDLIYPRVMVGSIDLSGTTKDQAKEIIQARIDKLYLSGLRFNYNSEALVVPIVPLSPDSAASYPLINFEINETIESAFGSSKERTFLSYLKSLWPKNIKKITPIYDIQEKRLEEYLSEAYQDVIVSAENAYFSAKKVSREEIALSINPEIAGKSFNFFNLLTQVKSNLNSLTDSEIAINLDPVQPEVSLEDLKSKEEEALELLKSGPLILKLDPAISSEIKGKNSWTVPASQLAAWLKVEKTNPHQTRLSLDKNKISAFLKDLIAPEIDQDAVLPRFEIKEGRVTSWQTGQPGYKLDVAASASIISGAFNKDTTEIPLAVEKITPASLTADTDFKIKEIIGTGHSRFAGSPKNRRHNISVGASSLHGLLIKPSEEFSLLKALGEIDGSTGYLTELVIKGDKTVPEYGGGLCQVGTTVFRSALSAGLPITERRNHSYRVSYYEPAGTDATIYDPAPDFKFINDTGNYILIQSRINGDDLYFDFWGVNDGRTATTTDPVIYNIVKPPPTKIIETDSLAPGQKKCTENAHSGADAYFDYTVVYPENSTTTPIKTRRFSSHYIPWQAVCLVGRASSTLESSATSTPSASGSPAISPQENE